MDTKDLVIEINRTNWGRKFEFPPRHLPIGKLNVLTKEENYVSPTMPYGISVLSGEFDDTGVLGIEFATDMTLIAMAVPCSDREVLEAMEEYGVMVKEIGQNIIDKCKNKKKTHTPS